MLKFFNKCNKLFPLKNGNVGRCFSTTVEPDYTKNQFDISRGDYNTLKQKHVDFFKNLLSEKRVIMDSSELTKYNIDWLRHLKGNCSMVLRPKNTEEVSEILRFCNENKLAVVPQGGNTGLVGGSIPVFDEVIISTELMNKVIKLDETAGVLVCQSGCVLDNLNKYVEDYGLMLPYDLAAKGSCHIGGNVSTNAGGLRLLRYGNLHGNILGVEAVKANGDIIDCLSSLKKDNTGYHLKHMFIGSEGTLGLITKVAIQCPTKPQFKSLAFLGVQDYDNVLKTLIKAKQYLNEILSAFEVMDDQTMKLINQHLNMSSPIGEHNFYLIVETSGSNEKHDQEKLHNFLNSLMENAFIHDGTIVTETKKMDFIWSMRERISEILILDGYVFCYDVSLPYKYYFEVVNETRAHMGKKSHRVFGFGHLGDQNLHLQVSVEKFTPEIKKYIESFLFKRVTELQGSISAEHGIGFLKKPHLSSTKQAESLNLMKSLKTMMDPNKILNPYKVL